MSRLKAYLLVTASLMFSIVGCWEKRSQDFRWEGLQNSLLTGLEKLGEESLDGSRLVHLKSASMNIKIARRPGDRQKIERAWSSIRDDILSYYTPHAAPYSGMISQVVDCPESLRPQALPRLQSAPNEDWKEGMISFANSRSVLGVCDPSLVAFQVLQAMVFCARPNVAFDIKISLPRGDSSAGRLQDIYNGFSCERN